VHRDNPAAGLTDEQVVGIYTGRLARWNDVGGKDAPITVVTKASGRATLDVFLAHFDLEEESIRADVVIGDNEQGIKTVAGDPNAIGFVSLGNAEYAAAEGVSIRSLPAGGVDMRSLRRYGHRPGAVQPFYAVYTIPHNIYCRQHAARRIAAIGDESIILQNGVDILAAGRHR